MKRSLKVELVLEKDGTVRAELRDIESGLHKTIEAPFSQDEHPEFDAAVGEELYSWLTLMADEMEKEEENLECALALQFPDMEPTDLGVLLQWRDSDGNPVEMMTTAAAWFVDWMGECEMCPPNDTPITGVIAGGETIYRDARGSLTFEEVMEAIRPTMVYHHWEDEDEDYIWCGEPENSEEPRYFIGLANALRYIEQNDVPYAKAIECIGICKECGQPVFPSREYGVWGYCHHCDACYAGPEDLE